MSLGVSVCYRQKLEFQSEILFISKNKLRASRCSVIFLLNFHHKRRKDAKHSEIKFNQKNIGKNLTYRPRPRPRPRVLANTQFLSLFSCTVIFELPASVLHSRWKYVKTIKEPTEATTALKGKVGTRKSFSKSKVLYLYCHT